MMYGSDRYHHHNGTCSSLVGDVLNHIEATKFRKGDVHCAMLLQCTMNGCKMEITFIMVRITDWCEMYLIIAKVMCLIHRLCNT